MLKHYVEFKYLMWGSISMVEHEVEERNPEMITVPELAAGYRFFDRIEEVVDGEKLVGKKRNISPFTYFGKVYTLDEVKKKFPHERALISNMEHAKVNKAVKIRNGKEIGDEWEFFTDVDTIIS